MLKQNRGNGGQGVWKIELLTPEADEASRVRVLHALRGSVPDMLNLQTLLPAPPGSTPEDYYRRDRAAISRIGARVPVNGDEAKFPAQAVAAHAHAQDFLCLARQHRHDLKRYEQLLAQSDKMMRQERGYRALLVKMQAWRMKRESTQASLPSAVMSSCTQLRKLRGVPPSPASRIPHA